MKPLPTLLAACGIAAAAILMVLAGLAWTEMQARLKIKDTLHANIAEMARIDEVLTTSALLAAVTGDTAYRDRYYAHVDILDDLLDVSIGLFDSDHAEEMLEKTNHANDWLVTAEERALGAMEGGPNMYAYARLRSAQYARHKAEYTEGLNAAMEALEGLAIAGIARMKVVLVLLAVIVILAILCFARMVVVARRSRLAMAEQEVRLADMRALLHTFMDLQNNLLNNMVYMRIKAAHGMAFDDDDIRIIDVEIDKAKARLSTLVDMGISSTRDLGGVVVLETDGGQRDTGRPAGTPRPVA